MPGKQPDYDACTPRAGGGFTKIGAAWHFEKGIRISLDSLPCAVHSTDYGTRTSILLFKRDEKEDAAPAEKAVEGDDSDLPF